MHAIVNYGHFWKRERVIFGSRGTGNAGELKGYDGPLSKQRIVEFRDQIAIYCLFSANREVVYIGQTGKDSSLLLNRLRSHTNNHLRDRWEYFSWFGLRSIKAKKLKSEEFFILNEKDRSDSEFIGTNAVALDEIEAVLIQLFEPRLNRQGPKWGKAEEFRQWDYEVEDDDSNSST